MRIRYTTETPFTDHTSPGALAAAAFVVEAHNAAPTSERHYCAHLMPNPINPISGRFLVNVPSLLAAHGLAIDPSPIGQAVLQLAIDQAVLRLAVSDRQVNYMISTKETKLREIHYVLGLPPMPYSDEYLAMVENEKIARKKRDDERTAYHKQLQAYDLTLIDQLAVLVALTTPALGKGRRQNPLIALVEDMKRNSGSTSARANAYRTLLQTLFPKSRTPKGMRVKATKLKPVGETHGALLPGYEFTEKGQIRKIKAKVEA